jgi:xylulokinase
VALLGIDLGTSGVRACLAGPDGNILGLGREEYPVSTPRPGWAEQDPETWWSAACRAIRHALHVGGVPPGEVAAVGLSGQMHGLVLLERSGAPVRPAIIWLDARTIRERGELHDLLGAARLLGITGLPPATGFFGVSLLWVRRHEPAAYHRASRAVLPKDYLRFRLTGEHATDPTDGSGTLLFDIRTRTWSHEILRALGIAPNLLPPVLDSAAVSGRVTERASRETGLPLGIPVATGGGDLAMGAIGSGVIEEGVVACTIGTGGQVVTAVRNPVIDPHGRLHTLCHPVAGLWLLMGATLAAGLSLRWFRDALGGAEVAGARRSGHDPYVLLTAEAEKAQPGSGGLVFLPYLAGERTPHMDPRARGCFVGLSLTHGRGHLIRAIMEGVAFSLRDSILIFRNLGVRVETVLCVGGGARSRLWRQIQADVYGVPVWRLAGEEHSAYGAALVAGVATGVYRDVADACRRAVRRLDVVPPLAENRALYDRQYAVYRVLYPALRETFAALA